MPSAPISMARRLAADYLADRLSVVVVVDARATAVSADVAHDVAAIVQGDPRVRVVAGEETTPEPPVEPQPEPPVEVEAPS